MASNSDPITRIFIVTAKENLAPSRNLIKLLTCTQRGHDADVFESSWRYKGKRYLCYEKDPTSTYIITDLIIIKDDEQVPNGFSGIFLTEDTKEKGLRKHILCVKNEVRNSATKGIAELALISQSKGERADPTFYTIANEVNELNLTFRVESLVPVQSNVLPRPQSSNRVNEMPLQMPRNTSGSFNTGSVPPAQPAAIMKSPVIGIEGVPFTVNPKLNFDSRAQDPIISSIPFITVDDINRQYQYDFNLENETVRKCT
ncbi:multivesicular body subunit 12A-like [Rhopilema esculentum]|uniref:multivesicular body subunit 12A-like n=1 Tax=Rhopilema esculentum TaxID=499914 RepID=UPI0031D0530B